MQGKPAITIVGPGSLGIAMARALHAARYRIEEIVHRGGQSARRARLLAREVGASAVTVKEARLAADVIWICVGDSAIAGAAAELAKRAIWAGKTAFHSSGALSSRELKAVRDRGAAGASVHPMMTFVRQARPELAGVTFAVEGDARAVRLGRRIALDLGGRVVMIDPRRKPMYHAFGAFTSPLVIATLAVAERVAGKAGIAPAAARAAIVPILLQTIRNYVAHGPAEAFSGPLVRGDVATVRRHLEVLKSAPEARSAYVALARSALKTLPVKRKREMERILKIED
jgi:predicted short-subunit dehydrogenase-like oxidoreductase (DUF2520 family)